MSSASCSASSSTLMPSTELGYFSAFLNPPTLKAAAGSMQLQSLMSTLMTLSPTNSTSSSNSNNNKDNATITPMFSFEGSSDSLTTSSQFHSASTKALSAPQISIEVPTPTALSSSNHSSSAHDCTPQSEALELMREIIRMHEQLQQQQSQPSVPLQQQVPNTTPLSAITPSPAFTSQEFLSVLLHQQYQQQVQQMLFRDAANAQSAKREEEQRGKLLRDYLLGLRPSPSLDAATAHDIMRLSSSYSSASLSSSSSSISPSSTKPVMSQPFPSMLPSQMHPLGTPMAALHPFMWINSGSATSFPSQPQPPLVGYSTLPALNFGFTSIAPISSSAATSSSSPKHQNNLNFACSSPQTSSSSGSALDQGRYITCNLGDVSVAKSRPHPTQPPTAKVSKRRRREPGAPKHPLSAYLFFVAEQRQLFAKTAFSAKRTFTEMAQLLGQRWRNMSKLEREPYEKKADQDKERYEQEKRDNQRRKTIAAAEKAIRDRNLSASSFPAPGTPNSASNTISSNSISHSSVASSEHSLTMSNSSSTNSTS